MWLLIQQETDLEPRRARAQCQTSWVQVLPLPVNTQMLLRAELYTWKVLDKCWLRASMDMGGTHLGQVCS